MKKIKTLGIVTMVILVLIIAAAAVLAALGVFGEESEKNEDSPGIVIDPSEDSQSGEENKSEENIGEITATIETDMGDIVIKMHDCAAAKKFIELDNSGKFDSAVFSTAVKDMFIQAVVTGENFEAEENDFGCFYGAVGFVMDNGKAAPSFFIITAKELSSSSLSYLMTRDFDNERISSYKEKGGIPEYEGKVLIFAQVISGMDVAEYIAEGENSGYAGGYSAAEPVKINNIEISYPTEAISN